MAKFSAAIEKAIKEVKGSGFWCGATEVRLRNLIGMLKRNDLSDAAVVETIKDFWTLVSAEYGE